MSYRQLPLSKRFVYGYEQEVLTDSERLHLALNECKIFEKERNDAFRRIEALEKTIDEMVNRIS